MQPKKYVNPKIALLNIELELKSEKENAEVRVNTVEVLFYTVCISRGKMMRKFIYEKHATCNFLSFR